MRRMSPRRPKLAFPALVLASTLVFGLAGHFTATTLIHRQQARQISELTEVVLRRAEFAVDFGAASLDQLASRGLTNCAPASLQAIRLHVYQRSTVKDVRLVNADGSVKHEGLDNHAMGTIFEELVRRLNEENNEEAGEHWTPRDAVRLMANLIFMPIADHIESGCSCWGGCCCSGRPPPSLPGSRPPSPPPPRCWTC